MTSNYYLDYIEDSRGNLVDGDGAPECTVCFDGCA